MVTDTIMVPWSTFLALPPIILRDAPKKITKIFLYGPISMRKLVIFLGASLTKTGGGVKKRIPDSHNSVCDHPCHFHSEMGVC